MITEWYFCNCINSTPKATKAFLCALETIDNPESDIGLKHVSLNELHKMNVWMQIYSISWILNSRHKYGSTPSFDEYIKKHFYELAELIPEEAASEFNRLIDCLFLNSGLNSELFDALEACAKLCLSFQDRTLSPIPYIDLKDFFAETFILCVAADNCTNQQNLAVGVSRLLSKEVSPFKHLFQNALNYQYGRLAFRMAIRIAYAASTDFSQNKLLSFTWKEQNSVGQFEPDILQTTAEILFSSKEYKPSPDKWALFREIQTEIHNFTWLRKLIEDKNFDASRLLHLLGMTAVNDRSVSLPIIFWHCILWEISARLDPIATASELAKSWHPPGYPLQNPVIVYSSFDEFTSDKWATQLAALLKLNNPRREIRCYPADTTQIPDKFTWAFFSPWVRFVESRDRIYKEEYNDLAYENATKQEVLIRLCAAIYISGILLQALPGDDPNRSVFVSLIAHGDAVLDDFKQWLMHFDTEGYSFRRVPELKLPITGLAIFANRQATMFGTGKITSVSPSEFVNILHKTDKSQESARISRDERTFIKRILPEVLFNWIEDAYTSVMDSNSSGRWLDTELISEIYEYFKSIPQDPNFEPFVPYLIIRFLCLESPANQNSSLDWREAKDKHGRIKGWRVEPRKLLLTRADLSWEDWNRNSGRWQDPEDSEWGPGYSYKYQSGTRIIRALERVSSFKNNFTGELPPANIQDKWKSELMMLLSGVNETQELDRFVRLRLLELIDDSVLRYSLDEQEQIALLLLEFGCVYDLNDLFRRVFFNYESEKPDAARTELQFSLLAAMKSELKVEIIKLRQLRSPQDPRLTYILYQKSTLIEEALTSIVYSKLIDKNFSRASKLNEILSNLPTESNSERGKTTIRSLKADIKFIDGEKKISVSPQQTKIEDWSIRAIINNPNSLKATIFFEDLDLSNKVDNLFETPNLTYHYQNNETHNVLARVVDKDESANTFVFNCGFKLITYRPLKAAHRFDDINLHDYVSLPITRRIDAETRKTYWRVSETTDNNIQVLKGHVRVNDIKRIKIKEISYPTQSTRDIVLMDESAKKQKTIKNYDRWLWDADVSRSFQKFNPSSEHHVFAILDEKGKWIPVDLNMTDLLLNNISPQTNTIVLTFIEEIVREFGEICWRFSTRPGENYLISQNHFISDDAQNLASEINKIGKSGDAYGLLISVEPVSGQNKILLKLCDNEVPNKFYPYLQNLQSPFDYRNIEWRTLFKRLENPFAVRDRKDWYYHLEEGVAEGYPRNVKVDLTQYNPLWGKNSAEFIPDDWELNNKYRGGIISGEYIWQNEINLKAKKLEEFVDKILFMKKTDRFILRQVVGKVSPTGDGIVNCLTRENLLVAVQVNSLNMLPTQSHSKPGMGGDRESEVVSIKDDNTAELKVDSTNLPQEVIDDGEARGVIIAMPDRAKGSVWTVLWKTSAGIRPQENFRVENLDEIKVKINLGCKITASYSIHGWRFVACPLYILVSALWKLEQIESNQDVIYLGTIKQADGSIKEIAQISPGRFGYVVREPKIKRHLSGGNDSENPFSKGSILNSKFINRTRTNYHRRVVLESAGSLLFGNYLSYNLFGDVMINRVRMYCTPLQDGLYSLERKFELYRVQTPELRRDDESNLQNTEEKLREKFEKYLKSQSDLSATFGIQNGKPGVWLSDMMIPLENAPFKWTKWVNLGDGEEQYIASGYPSKEATVQLFEDGNGRILASFRRVPPMPLDDFFMASGSIMNEPVSLKEILYYIGPEKEYDEQIPDKVKEVYHRFEMGYGRTLLIPAERLQYHEGDFNQIQFVLYYGDIISNITFLKNQNSENHADVSDETADAESREYIISINKFDVKYSHGRTLFNQRRKYQIIHLLHTIAHENQIKIKFIEGLDEESLSRDLSSFEEVQANLEHSTEERLLKRVPEIDRHKEKEITILGRLNEKRFRESLGKELYFEQVRLSFEESTEHASPVKDRERVFLRATAIEEQINDFGLYLTAPHRLGKIDVGDDFAERFDKVTKKWKPKIRILRRTFSVRENLLSRVLKQDGRYGLEGRLFLIKLSKENNEKILCELFNKAPSRKSTALLGKILTKRFSYAAVVALEDKSIILELEPGILVTLKREQVVESPETLEKGSIVKIESAKNPLGNDSDKFILTEAAFSDTRYIGEELRPAVTLPQNTLLKESFWEGKNIDKDEFWENKEHFTIGGLPNIVARPGHYEKYRRNWTKPIAASIIKLLETPHPKLVSVGFDNSSNKVRIEPLEELYPVGSLRIEEKSLGVSFIPSNKAIVNTHTRFLNWANLTYSDEPITEIVKRLKQETWQYHDKFSGYWGPDNNIEAQDVVLKRHNVLSGPVFFEILPGPLLSLRYNPRRFWQFGFPVAELFQSLWNKPGVWYSVAGVSGDGGLWIEIIPGRIVEISTNLIVFKSKSLKDIPLAQLDWEAFSPGDRIKLKKATADSFEIDYVELLDWQPGPRKSFGSEESLAFLPVEDGDKINGALTLGAGKFKLKIPIDNPPSDWETVTLSSTNKIVDISKLTNSKDCSPIPGDVVLLGIAKNNPVIIGLEEFYHCPIDDDDIWASDPFAKWIRTLKDLRTLIETVGGALPVTVEEVDHKTRTIYYSRQHQQTASDIPLGKFNMARVVGLLDKRTAVLRCGGGLIKMVVNQIISGLPESCFAAAIKLLKDSQTIIWIRRNADTHLISAAIMEEANREILVESIGFIQQDVNAIHPLARAGLICRSVDSLALYWLPQELAAWVQIPPKQIEHIFTDKKMFKVRLMDETRGTQFISVINTNEAEKEFLRLEIGKELAVKIIEPLEMAENDNPKKFIAESLSSKVLMLFETSQDNKDYGVILPSEVIKRSDDEAKLVVTPLGSRQYYLDLPKWVNELPMNPRNRLEMRNYLEWSDTASISDLPDMDLKEADNETIKKLLSCAYHTTELNREYFQKQVKCALQWIERTESAPEIFLPYAIMAILILNRCASLKETELMEYMDNEANIKDHVNGWKNKASLYMQHIGHRALRSAHVEILGEHWFFNPDHGDEGISNLSYRLSKLINHVQTPLNIDSLRLIQNFCYAIKIRKIEKLTAISHALAVSLGNLEDIIGLYESTEYHVTKTLVDIYRSLPKDYQDRYTTWLKPFQIENLEELLFKINKNSIDITLLDNLVLKKAEKTNNYKYY